MAILFAFLAMLCWGVAPILEKQGLRGSINPLVGVTVRSVAIVIISFILIFLWGQFSELKTSISDKYVLYVIAGGVLAGLVGQIAFYSALKSGQASVVVPIAAGYPLVSLVLSILFLKEQVSAAKVIGVVLIVLGIWLVK